MKKVLCAALSLALLLCLSVAVFAEDDTFGPDNTLCWDIKIGTIVITGAGRTDDYYHFAVNPVPWQGDTKDGDVVINTIEVDYTIENFGFGIFTGVETDGITLVITENNDMHGKKYDRLNISQTQIEYGNSSEEGVLKTVDLPSGFQVTKVINNFGKAVTINGTGVANRETIQMKDGVILNWSPVAGSVFSNTFLGVNVIWFIAAGAVIMIAAAVISVIVVKKRKTQSKTENQ